MSEINKQLDAVISKYIRPGTFPVAIRRFKADEELPPRTKLPRKDFGNGIAACQALALARRMGWTVAMRKEDHACGPCEFITGWIDEPDFIKDGSIVKPLYASNDAAAILTQQTTPKMPEATTEVLVFAPLDKCTFEPEVVVVYGNAAQIIRMVQGAIYHTGGYVESRFSGRAACGSWFTVPVTQDRCNVIIPGGGERVFALDNDDELAFAIPTSKFQDVIEGVEAVHKNGAARIPTPYVPLTHAPQLPSKYNELQRYCGVLD